MSGKEDVKTGNELLRAYRVSIKSLEGNCFEGEIKVDTKK